MALLKESDVFGLGIIGSILLLIIFFGFGIINMRNFKLAIFISWLLVITSFFFISTLINDYNPIIRMIVIILVLLYGIKIIVTCQYYKDKNNNLSFLQWLIFVTCWFGMKPNVFESLGKKTKDGSLSLIKYGITRFVAGILCIILSGFILIQSPTFPLKLLSTALSLIGLSLFLHFGILNISAGFWRYFGADTKTLFNAPLKSISLSEFWGKRWNIAFSEMTSIAVYRPLKKKLKPTTAIFIAFLFSGLLHELAISVPVKAGYGLPLLYFLIHAIIMLLEKKMEANGVMIGKTKWIGRLWVYFWLLLPLPLLFHINFLSGIVWPMVENIALLVFDKLG